MQHMKEEGTHGKKGIMQEKVSLGIVRGRGYKIERNPIIWDHFSYENL